MEAGRIFGEYFLASTSTFWISPVFNFDGTQTPVKRGGSAVVTRDVKRTNAWLDAYKALLIRFETNEIHWKALNLMSFCIILLRQL